MTPTGTSQTITALRKLGINIKRPKLYKEPIKKKSAFVPPNRPDPKVTVSLLEDMRLIKERYILRTIDLVELLRAEGYETNRGALQQVLVGLVKGTDRRKFDFENKTYKSNLRNGENDGLVTLHGLFKKIEQSLKPKTRHLINRDMRAVMDDWFEELGIEFGDRSRQLAKSLGLSHSTWFRYYSENRYPKTIFILLDVDKRVKEAAKELKGNGK